MVCQLIICIICGFLKSGKARAWLPKNQEGAHGGFSKVRFQKPERHGERHGGAFATCESGAFATCEKTRPAFQLARSHGPQGAEHCCACEVCLVSACVLCLRGLPGLGFRPDRPRKPRGLGDWFSRREFGDWVSSVFCPRPCLRQPSERSLRHCAHP